MTELVAAVEAGASAAVVFVVQRPDADLFSPYPEVDAALAAALREAADRGVAVRAFTCHVTLASIAIAREIPVDLAAPCPPNVLECRSGYRLPRTEVRR